MPNQLNRVFMLLLMVFTQGCMKVDSTQDVTAEKPQNKPKPGLKTTDEIGEFDPAADQTLVDSKVKVSNPITAPLEAYGPLKVQVAELGIQQAVEMFRATEGRYPKDHDEFMQKVIKANRIRLPQPNSGQRYQYDVENHKLVVVQE